MIESTVVSRSAGTVMRGGRARNQLLAHESLRRFTASIRAALDIYCLEGHFWINNCQFACLFLIPGRFIRPNIRTARIGIACDGGRPWYSGWLRLFNTACRSPALSGFPGFATGLRACAGRPGALSVVLCASVAVFVHG